MQKSNWVIPLLLAGCVPLTTKSVGREIDLTVYPKIAPKTQAILNPNTLSSIATLDIIPYVYDSGAYKPISSVTGTPTTPGAIDMLKLTEASPSIDPNRPFVIRHLKANKNYRVRAQAYNQTNALISEDTTSYVDVSVGSNDAPPMASLPINLVNTTFGARTSVLVNTDGHYEYLKATLYLVAGGGQVAIAQTHHLYPTFSYNNLQVATDYRLLIEAYKLGTMMASTSLTFNPGNETLPATQSVSLTIPYVTSTYAGGVAGFVDGTGTGAAIGGPTGVVIDGQNNLYFVDSYNCAIRKITPAGVVTTLAGNGTGGFADGTGFSAQFKSPHALTIDYAGNLYVGDRSNHRIRKVTPQGVVTTIAGNGATGYSEGTGTAATLYNPVGTAVDPQGNIYFTDEFNHRIRKINSQGVVTTFAGNDAIGMSDGTGTAAMFYYPRDLAFDAWGNLFVSDRGYNIIRKITPQGVVTTIAGNGTAGFADGSAANAQFRWPEMLTVDQQGNIYVSEADGNRIRKINPQGYVQTIAGNGVSNYADGTGTAAQFGESWGITQDNQGILYVGDYTAKRIRKVE